MIIDTNTMEVRVTSEELLRVVTAFFEKMPKSELVLRIKEQENKINKRKYDLLK